MIGSDSEIADILKVLLQVSDANAADGAALAAEPSPADQGGGKPDGEDADSDADLTKHLHMLANVTGISFSEVKHAPLPGKKGKGGAGNAIRRYNLEGSVFGLGFGLEFDVLEAAMAVRWRQHLAPSSRRFIGLSIPRDHRRGRIPSLSRGSRRLLCHVLNLAQPWTQIARTSTRSTAWR